MFEVGLCMIETSHRIIDARKHSTASGQDRTGRITVTYDPSNSFAVVLQSAAVAAAANCSPRLDFRHKSPRS